MSETIEINNEWYKKVLVDKQDPCNTCDIAQYARRDCSHYNICGGDHTIKLKKYQPLDLNNLPPDFTPENYKVQFYSNMNSKWIPSGVFRCDGACAIGNRPKISKYRYKPRKQKPESRQITDRDRLMARVTQMVFDNVCFYIRAGRGEWCLPGYFSLQGKSTDYEWIEFEPITGKPIGEANKFTEKIPLDNNQAGD